MYWVEINAVLETVFMKNLNVELISLQPKIEEQISSLLLIPDLDKC